MIPFENRPLIIATKHGKESILAPILEKELGVKCFIDPNFDSDLLGTFTGEIERKLDPISTVREKCISAMKANNCDLGVANEGSFGPHPTLFFTHADEEFLIFIDLKNNLEILVREISLDTNFNGKQIKNREELIEFAEGAKFPQHGIILRKSREENQEIYKGIKDQNTLQNVFKNLHSKYGCVYVETDMRAMHNPTRMNVIQQAALKLVDTIKSTCPKCETPGFTISEAKKGLPCNSCGYPTQSTLSYIYSCKKCDHTLEKTYPNQKKNEDPMYCDICNP